MTILTNARVYNRNNPNNIPRFSSDLDSVRPYQFEVQFFIPGQLAGPAADALQSLTIAARQVQAGGLKVEEVAAHRLNDVYYYPGKASMDELQITFDNILLTRSGKTLYDWFRACTYDPLTGLQSKIVGVGNLGRFKAPRVRVIEYNGRLQPHAYVDYIGVFPKSLQYGERNYATSNEFHTVQMNFRYDLIDTAPATGEGDIAVNLDGLFTNQ